MFNHYQSPCYKVIAVTEYLIYVMQSQLKKKNKETSAFAKGG
jgi:hypothetical protein